MSIRRESPAAWLPHPLFRRNFQPRFRGWLRAVSYTHLTLEEAAAYSGIGINKLREITNEDKCKFVLWVGNKRLIKRRLFDCYIEQAYSI